MIINFLERMSLEKEKKGDSVNMDFYWQLKIFLTQSFLVGFKFSKEIDLTVKKSNQLFFLRLS